MARDKVSVSYNELIYARLSKQFIVEASAIGLSPGEIPIVITIHGRWHTINFYYAHKESTGVYVYKPTPTDEQLIPQCQGTSLHVLNT